MDSRVYFGGLLYFYDIIAFVRCQLSWASKTWFHTCPKWEVEEKNVKK